MAKSDTKSGIKPDIRKANAAYERWLREELRDPIVEADLRTKHEKMSSGPFPFLRATYWRWAETILDICPKLRNAPQVLAVGDIHLENYGMWRDDDGRLVWGVNDFDEAAVMPYALDLVRLAASAALARPSRRYRNSDTCGAILQGYVKGLENPRPFVLDKEHPHLRSLLVVDEMARAKFWAKVAAQKSLKKPPKRFRRAIAAAMPESGLTVEKYYPRQAGTGSLGRQRWVGVADWRGGLVLREAKALVSSGWVRARGLKSRRLHVREIAAGRYRAPDPWYSANDELVVRRLSPNTRKIEVAEEPEELLSPRMLAAMGHELANIHLGTGDHRRAIERDLAKRKDDWLHRNTLKAAAFVAKEFEQWRGKRGRL
jgi:Ser/Thr protein kinase RdoA (MazF antagonist)